MSALMIKDLPIARQLDDIALKSVRGGNLAGPLFPGLSFMFDNSKTINAPQWIQQGMTITNVSGNSNPSPGGSTTQIIPMMKAANNMVVN